MAFSSTDSSLNIIVKLVDNASKELKTLSDQFDKAGDSISTNTEKAQNFTKVVGGVALAVGGIAVNEFMQFEKSMSGVKAVLDPTAQEFDALTKKAQELGKETTFTQTEVADGLEMLAKNGLNASQILNGAADATTYLAAATGTDFSTAADIATDSMGIFNIAAEDMSRAINQISGVTVASKFTIDDYKLALAQGGGVAKAVGVTFEDFNTSIAGISNLFASGSDAGTSFKVMLQRLVPASDEAAELMQELGLEFFDANGKMKGMAEISQELQDGLKGLSDEQKNNALSTIFGTDAMRAAVGMAGLGEEGFKKLQEQIGKTDAMKQAEIRLDNLAGAWEKFTGSLSVVTVNLGAKIGAILEPALLALSDFIDNFSANWDALNPTMQNVILAVGGVAAAITGLVVVIGSLGMVLPVILGGLSAVAGAFSLLLSPIGLVIAALAGLTLAYTTNFGGFGDFVDGVVKKLMPLFEAIIDGVVDIYNEISDYIGRLKGPFDKFLTVYGPLIDKFLKIMGTSFSNTFDGIIQVVTGGWEIIEGVFKLGITLILGAFEVFLSLLSGDWQGAWDGIKNMGRNSWEALKTIFSGGQDVIAGAAKIWLNNVGLIFQQGWNSIKTYAGIFWEWTKSTASSSLSSLFSNTQNVLGNISNAWNNTWTTIKNIVLSAWDGIKSAISSGINWVIDKINGLISAANTVSGSVGGPQITPLKRVNFQNGGIVPGGEFTGIVPGGKNPANHDQVLTGLDPGELVLNRAQQKSLASQLNTGGAINITFNNVTINNGMDLQDLGDYIEKTVIRATKRANLGLIT